MVNSQFGDYFGPSGYESFFCSNLGGTWVENVTHCAVTAQDLKFFGSALAGRASLWLRFNQNRFKKDGRLVMCFQYFPFWILLGSSELFQECWGRTRMWKKQLPMATVIDPLCWMIPTATIPITSNNNPPAILLTYERPLWDDLR